MGRINREQRKFIGVPYSLNMNLGQDQSKYRRGAYPLPYPPLPEQQYCLSKEMSYLLFRCCSGSVHGIHILLSASSFFRDMLSKKHLGETFNTKFRVQYGPEKEKTDNFWPIFTQNVRLFPFLVTKEIQ